MKLLRRGLRAGLALVWAGLAGHSGAQVPQASPVPSSPSAARYEYDAIGQVTRIVRGDGNAGVSLTCDRLGRITSGTDERGGTTRIERSRDGRAEAPLTWRHDEVGPEFSYGIGRLTSTGYGAGGSRYRYEAHGEVVPLLSGVRWAPFGMWIDGWDGDTEGGVLAHRRSFDLSGRMTRHPIRGVVRDLRDDTRDRILNFTHTEPDGTTAPFQHPMERAS